MSKHTMRTIESVGVDAYLNWCLDNFEADRFGLDCGDTSFFSKDAAEIDYDFFSIGTGDGCRNGLAFATSYGEF